jgi:hypothetical protein
MCCRACSGYELCRTGSKLKDDCCPECRYFESCMEEPTEEEDKPRPAPRRRTVRS